MAAAADSITTAQLYLQLAHEHEKRGRAQERDRFMLLAADAAYHAGHSGEADRIRLNLLNKNPHHLLKPFAHMSEALRSPDISAYLDQLRHSFPPEKVTQLLRELREEMIVTLRGDENLDEEFQLPLDLETKLRRETATPPSTRPLPPPAPPAAVPTPAARPPRENPAVYRMQEESGTWFQQPAAASSSNLYKVPEKKPRRRREAEAAEPDGTAGGGWVGVAACVLVFAGALALAGYVFVKPFLPG